MTDRRTLLAGTAALAALLPLRTALAASAHDFAFDAIDGGEIHLSDFAGGPVLVVNTASLCGYTPQYEGLQAIWEAYRDRGLTVVGIPSDDFGGQEKDTEAEVKDFCETVFSVDFPLAAITRVSGTQAHPFYLWAEQELGAANAPRWNFHKYLVGADGRLIRAFPTRVEPDSAEVREAIEKALPASR